MLDSPATFGHAGLYYTPGMVADDDRPLVRRAQERDLQAYGELVQRHEAAVFRVCWRLLGDRAAAEDAAQESFIRAYDRLDTFDLSRPFGPWIRKVATNWCLNRLAATRPTVALDDEDDRGPVGPAGERPENVQQGREREQTIRAALSVLPDRHRAVVELRHFQDLSYSEISAALKLPVSDVKSYLFRARRLLAERLGHLRDEA